MQTPSVIVMLSVAILFISYFLKDPACDLLEFSKSPKLFILAHPDDETMFFVPTIEKFVISSIPVKFLYFSYGGNETRINEVVSALEYLTSQKITYQVTNSREFNSQSVSLTIINSTNFADSQTTLWDSKLIAQYLSEFLSRNEDIVDLYSFDHHGISGHINHRDLSAGVRNYVTHSSQERNVEFYQLISTNLVTKYMGILSYMKWRFMKMVRSENDVRERVIIGHWHRAYMSLMNHRSQLTWYRYLYIVFARYAYINEYQLLV